MNFGSNKQVQFVAGPDKPWSNEEIIKDLNIKALELFTGDHNNEFLNRVNKAIADGEFTKIFKSDIDISQKIKSKKKGCEWFIN